MVWFGVPILDWVLLLVLIGLGIEAWLTTRPSSGDAEKRREQPEKPDTERQR
jgi:hypothetical protein